MSCRHCGRRWQSFSMSRRCLAVLLIFAFATLGLAPGASAQEQWRVQWKLISGSNFCNVADFGWIRAGAGKFRFFDTHNKKEIWAADMSEDGSVKDVQVRSGYSNRPYRVTVPPGTAPRAFDLLDLTYVCRIRMEPV